MKKLYFIFLLFSNLFIAACSATAETRNAPIYTEALENPLLQIANMKYEGGFVFSSGEFGSSSLHGAEGGMAYAPPKPSTPNGSIFATGNFVKGGVSEWAIPSLVNSRDIDELNFVKQPLQSFVDVRNKASKRRVKMGYFADLLWLDNQLLYSEHNYYPASDLKLNKLGVLREADNLEESPADGYFSVNAISGEETRDSYTASSSSGWMSEIPKEWQTMLGGTHLIGPADGWNIAGRFAAGPSVFAFNPEIDVLNKIPEEIIGSTPLVDYATENPMTETGNVGPEYINAPSDLWNSMSFVQYGFIPGGSRTLMLVGNQWGINGDIGYKVTQDTGKLCGGPCPFQADDESNYYWLIDLRDVFAARRGKRRYDSITPYSYGPLPLPFQKGRNGQDQMRDLVGGAYDARTGTVYFQLLGGDPRPEFDLRPVFLAYTFDTSTKYPVPSKPVWTQLSGKKTNSTKDQIVEVVCQDCNAKSIAVSWKMPKINAFGKLVSIDHFKLHYENMLLPYSNKQRNQRIGVTVSGDKFEHVQTLMPGKWRVTIRAISKDGVPSEL